jgi:hypothetical protein
LAERSVRYGIARWTVGSPSIFGMDNEWWSGLTASGKSYCPILNTLRVSVCSSSRMRPVHARVACRLVLLQGDISHLHTERGEAMKCLKLDADDIIYLVTACGYDHSLSFLRALCLSRTGLVCPASKRRASAWPFSTMLTVLCGLC